IYSLTALPAFTDVVTVGSGITDTAFACTLLDADGSMEVGMLEARDACSGATVRNGRHIMPTLYHDYHNLKKKHCTQAAKQIIQFMLSHLEKLISAAEEETEENQCCKYDAFFDKDVFEKVKEKLGRYLEELPSEKGGWGTTKGSAEMRLADGVCGVISTTGSAMHPYRLVAGILSRLLKTYSSFRLYTHTPCLSIYDNIIHTPRGDGRPTSLRQCGKRSFLCVAI
ncbi:hypothetical protein ARMSODRAFT_1069247, partial [Armillaria solidipes]